jgi:peptidoglycan/LPS O-acetylase OafA/YrhL
MIDRLLPLWLGVQLFFVLSGFLITGILLKGEPTGQFIGTF